MRRAVLACIGLLAATLPARADMYQDARNAELPAALDNLGAMARDAANATLPQAQDNLGIARSVAAYGAKCDNATNDTVAIQAAIDANPSGAVSLPTGRCIVSNLLITKSIRIAGQGNKQSFLVSPNGSTAPVFTVQVDTMAGFYPAVVQFDNFNITSVSRIDPPGLNNVHGMRLKTTGGVKAQVVLNNFTIDEVPGSCLYAEGGETAGLFVNAVNFNCLLPSQYGIYANSAADWTFYGGQLYGATVHNVMCAGCGYFHFTNVNSFSAAQNNLRLFNPQNFWWAGGSLDRAGQEGVFVDNRTGNNAVYISGATIGYNGTSANLTYADLALGAANTKDIYLTDVEFWDKSAALTANKPLWNLQAIAGNTGYAYAKNVSFRAGNWLTTGVMGASSARYRGAEPAQSWTPSLIGTGGGTATMAVQAGKYVVNNGHVHLWGKVQTSSLAGVTGNLRVSGFPVGVLNEPQNDGMCTVQPMQGWTAPAGYTYLTGLMQGASAATSILLYRNATNAAAAAETAASEWAAASIVSFSCDYRY